VPTQTVWDDDEAVTVQVENIISTTAVVEKAGHKAVAGIS
jgi:hypothetical protein